MFDGNKNHTNVIHHTHNGMDRLNFSLKFTARQAYLMVMALYRENWIIRYDRYSFI
jgi:hypothetical protein